MPPSLQPWFRWLRRYGLVVLLLGVVGYQLATAWVPAWINASRLKGTDVSHLVLVDEQGRAVPLARFSGRPLILNFWATWCLPCRLEIPQLRSAYPELKAQGKHLVGVNYRESWREINAYRAESPIPYPVLVDRGEVADVLGIQIIPALVVVGADGRVDKIVYGYRPWMKWYLLWWV